MMLNRCRCGTEIYGAAAMCRRCAGNLKHAIDHKDDPPPKSDDDEIAWMWPYGMAPYFQPDDSTP